MGINRRGVFFTITVLTVATLLLVSYSFFGILQERQAVQKRIDTMNNFLFSLEEDVPRQLFISGFRGIFLMQKHIIENGEYIADTEATFEEIFFNGTVLGESDDDIVLLMEDATFDDLLENVQEKGEKINVIINMTNPVVAISQVDPWNVRIRLITNFSMNDLSGLASWNREWVVDSFVPIQGFQDPIYAIEGTIEEGIPVSNNITRSPYNNANFSTGTLQEHIDNAYYINFTGAPSYLDRLEGNFTAQSEYGIESLVPSIITTLSPGRSVVDHEYFSGTSGAYIGCGMSSYVVIDAGHTARYLPC